MNIAIIPARGGSKRIPKKNIRDFAGKPMIAHSIAAAQASGLFEHIVVSTDSAEIAEVAIASGAEVPFMRPADLADDFTGTRAVTNQAIKACEQHFGPVEMACCIYATAPFLQSEYLRAGYDGLQQLPDQAFAFAATTFAFPVQRALVAKDGGVVPMYPEHINKRSQDLAEGIHDAGQFYWGRRDDYLSSLPMFSVRSIPVMLPRYLVQDIDTEEDWQRAELMFHAYHQLKSL